jgi:transketolase
MTDRDHAGRTTALDGTEKVVGQTARPRHGWDHYVGGTSARIGMHTFGASAPIKDLPAKRQLALAKEKSA